MPGVDHSLLLYRHVRQCIFAFLTLNQLAIASCVQRTRWRPDALAQPRGQREWVAHGSSQRVHAVLRSPIGQCMTTRVTWACQLQSPSIDGTIYPAVAENDQTSRLVLLVVEFNGIQLRHVRSDLRSGVVCRAAVKQNGLAIEAVSTVWCDDLVLLAMDTNVRALNLAPLERQTQQMRDKWCACTVDPNRSRFVQTMCKHGRILREGRWGKSY